MSTDRPDSRIAGEDRLAYAGFLCFNDERDLEAAYKEFMQNNSGALNSFKQFLGWASRYRWQERVNAIDAEAELATVRETRRAGLGNNLTAEEMYKELTKTCMEEFQLHRSELAHKDIIGYLKIANDINARWQKKDDAPQVVVNVEQSNTTVDIPEEVLHEIGKRIVTEEECQS